MSPNLTASSGVACWDPAVHSWGAAQPAIRRLGPIAQTVARLTLCTLLLVGLYFPTSIDGRISTELLLGASAVLGVGMVLLVLSCGLVFMGFEIGLSNLLYQTQFLLPILMVFLNHLERQQGVGDTHA